jgi:hypothetical protein
MSGKLNSVKNVLSKKPNVVFRRKYELSGKRNLQRWDFSGTSFKGNTSPALFANVYVHYMIT